MRSFMYNMLICCCCRILHLFTDFVYAIDLGMYAYIIYIYIIYIYIYCRDRPLLSPKSLLKLLSYGEPIWRKNSVSWKANWIWNANWNWKAISIWKTSWNSEDQLKVGRETGFGRQSEIGCLPPNHRHKKLPLRTRFPSPRSPQQKNNKQITETT